MFTTEQIIAAAVHKFAAERRRVQNTPVTIGRNPPNG